MLYLWDMREEPVVEKQGRLTRPVNMGREDYVDRGTLEPGYAGPSSQRLRLLSLARSIMARSVSYPHIHTLADAATSPASQNASFPLAGVLRRCCSRDVRLGPAGEKISGTNEG